MSDTSFGLRYYNYIVKYGYALAELKRLAQSGKIKAVQLPDGDMVVSENSVKEKTRKEDLLFFILYRYWFGISNTFGCLFKQVLRKV